MSAKVTEQMDQSDCAKGTNENVGEASSEQAAVPPDLKTCSEGVRQNGKVFIPDNLSLEV